MLCNAAICQSLGFRFVCIATKRSTFPETDVPIWVSRSPSCPPVCFFLGLCNGGYSHLVKSSQVSNGGRTLPFFFECEDILRWIVFFHLKPLRSARNPLRRPVCSWPLASSGRTSASSSSSPTADGADPTAASPPSSSNEPVCLCLCSQPPKRTPAKLGRVICIVPAIPFQKANYQMIQKSVLFLQWQYGQNTDVFKPQTIATRVKYKV